MNPSQVIVVGGGAAGMMAAITAAAHGADVGLIERNPRMGRKLYITGKVEQSGHAMRADISGASGY